MEEKWRKELKYTVTEGESVVISAPEPTAGIPSVPTDKPLQTDQVSRRSTDLPVPPSFSKPLSETKALTPDRVKELKQNEDIIQLLYIAEQYLGKTLTPTETRKILFFYDELHMSVDLIDYLIEYCVGPDFFPRQILTVQA